MIEKDFFYKEIKKDRCVEILYLMEHADAKSLIIVPFGKWWNTDGPNMLKSVGKKTMSFNLSI